MHLAASTDGDTTVQDLTYPFGTGFSGGGGGWIGYDISPSGIKAGGNTFKITLYTGTGQSYDPEISQVTLGFTGCGRRPLFLLGWCFWDVSEGRGRSLAGSFGSVFWRSCVALMV
jgi:hypothetical protein